MKNKAYLELLFNVHGHHFDDSLHDIYTRVRVRRLEIT